MAFMWRMIHCASRRRPLREMRRNDMTYTRRELGKLMLTLPVAGLLPRDVFAGVQGKPNSKWAGVQVGLNGPYNFGPPRAIPVDDVIAKTAQLGVSAVELRSQPIELF